MAKKRKEEREEERKKGRKKDKKLFERSFSTRRRIKTWLRTNMDEDRLVGLALMNIHKEEEIDVNEVIDIFAKSKTRRLEFVL